MNKWSDRPWDERLNTLGDPAETAFINWADQQGYPAVRYGLNRPPIDMSRMPPFIRYTPDFLTSGCLYEVQGCGKDHTFKFKHDKLWALYEWHQHHTTRLWLWNQVLDAHVEPTITQVLDLCRDFDGGHRVDGMFDGTKPYAAVTWDRLVNET